MARVPNKDELRSLLAKHEIPLPEYYVNHLHYYLGKAVNHHNTRPHPVIAKDVRTAIGCLTRAEAALRKAGGAVSDKTKALEEISRSLEPYAHGTRGVKEFSTSRLTFHALLMFYQSRTGDTRVSEKSRGMQFVVAVMELAKLPTPSWSTSRSWMKNHKPSYYPHLKRHVEGVRVGNVFARSTPDPFNIGVSAAVLEFRLNSETMIEELERRIETEEQAIYSHR